MGVFGFIENFFFVSLGIVFVLILLLVYHFKKRMSVAEKKSESMYGLLTTIVKEIKNIRSTFGSYACKTSAGHSVPVSCPIDSGNKPKTDPEINISIKSSTAVSASSTPASPEVITLDLAATENPTLSRGGLNKIVVSEDDESDSEPESEYEEDYESEDDESEPESEDDESEDEVENIVLEPVCELQQVESNNYVKSTSVLEELQLNATIVDIDANPVEQSLLETPVPEVVSALEEFSVVEAEQPAAVENMVVEEGRLVGCQPLEEDENAVSVVSKPEKLSADHLRKMNINQLRTIAIQRGITADTSKMKKNELITLIQSE